MKCIKIHILAHYDSRPMIDIHSSDLYYIVLRELNDLIVLENIHIPICQEVYDYAN